MPQKYIRCIDCGEPKTTYSQQKSARCRSCVSLASKSKHYMFCIDCGEPKTTVSTQRTSRCRSCAMKQLRGENNSRWSGGPIDCICIICGGTFQVIKSRAEKDNPRFCSSKCYGVWRSHNIRGEKCCNWNGGPQEHICEQCGQVFIGRSDRLFCSRECVSLWLSENASGEDSWNWKGGPQEYICEMCGTVFHSNNKENANRFCSRRCFSRWQKEYIPREKRANWKGGKEEYQCEQCGCFFRAWASCGARRFCSVKCYAKWQSQNLSGENSYQWDGGRSFEPYHEDFNRALKTAVRERDGHLCVLCGKTEKENGRKLSVHHITYDKQSCDMDLMVSLCIGCHVKTNRNRDFWQQVFTKYRGRSLKQDWQMRVVVM